jgi:hypothetical protein
MRTTGQAGHSTRTLYETILSPLLDEPTFLRYTPDHSGTVPIWSIRRLSPSPTLEVRRQRYDNSTRHQQR